MGEEKPEGDPEPETKRSEPSPTTAGTDIAADEPTLEKSPDIETTVERWMETLKEHGKG